MSSAIPRERFFPNTSHVPARRTTAQNSGGNRGEEAPSSSPGMGQASISGLTSRPELKITHQQCQAKLSRSTEDLIRAASCRHASVVAGSRRIRAHDSRRPLSANGSTGVASRARVESSHVRTRMSGTDPIPRACSIAASSVRSVETLRPAYLYTSGNDAGCRTESRERSMSKSDHRR